MRKDRFNSRAMIVLFGCLATAIASAGDTIVDEQVDADLETIESVASDLLPELELAVLDDITCIDMGGFDDVRQSTAPERFRGNVYRIQHTVKLQEAKMELQIFNGAEVQLSFSFHRTESVEGLRTFTRIAPDLEMTVIGNGFATVYSPGPLPAPLTLYSGYDYLIGVSWYSTSVNYGRDDRPYPRSFLHGKILGLVTQNIAPPLPDELGPLSIFQSGAYSMELCFDSVDGACCGSTAEEANGYCEQRLPSECVEPGAYFHGERVPCADVQCWLGACCFPCDNECGLLYTPEACEAEGGDHTGPAVECAEQTILCPEIKGACCRGASCSEVCIGDCEAIGGTYLGDATTCEPNFCSGACCVDGGCLDTTSNFCNVLGGGYRGAGTTCATLPPELECGGACCYGFFEDVLDSCEVFPERALCAYDRFPDGVATVYRGDGASCPIDPLDDEDGCGDFADFGACCLPDGTCVNTTPAFCAAPWILGVFSDTRECGDGIPDDGSETVCVTGECCLADGTCRILTEDGCGLATGIDVDPPWTEGGTCDPETHLCEAPTGACCVTDTDGGTDCYVDRTEAACVAVDGDYMNDGSVCDPYPCVPFGACCRPNGECTGDYVTEATCDSPFNGLSWGAGGSCDPENEDFVDCAKLGACCAENGVCFEEMLQSQCESDAVEYGQFLGEGVACPEGGFCPTRACCLGTECRDVTAYACDEMLGVHRADQLTCEPNPCIDIISSSPTNCGIDARQQFEHDGSDLLTYEIELEFDADTTGLAADDFDVRVVPTYLTPIITSVIPSANTATLLLDLPLADTRWTCITHIDSDAEICVGRLPGDVDGSGENTVDDVTALIDYLNGGPALGWWQCDIDRSGSCTAADLLRLIDLFNGADPFGPLSWLNETMNNGESCPSAPPASKALRWFDLGR